MTIPEPKKDDTLKIPGRVALNPDEKDIEAEPFKISFKHYNDRECEIRHLNQSSARKALSSLRTIGQLAEVKQFAANNIKSTPITRSGVYKCLFKTLPKADDVDLFEYNLSGASRVFYFALDKMLYLVAIRNSHYEIGRKAK